MIQRRQAAGTRPKENASEPEWFVVHSSKAPVMEARDLPLKDLDDMLGEAGKSFRQKLFELIDASGMDDVTVYKKANIDRKVFSRISNCLPDRNVHLSMR